MGKILAKTLLGGLFLFCGFSIVFLYITHINNGANLLLYAVTALPCIGVGIFLLLQAGNSDNSVVNKPKKNGSMQPTEHFENIVTKQNQMVSEWNQTTTMRDRLKLLRTSMQQSSTDNS